VMISSTFSMGKGSRREGRQLTRFFSCSNPSETGLSRSWREHLLSIHSPVGGCASFLFPSSSDLLGAISDPLATSCSGLRGEGRGDLGGRIPPGGWWRAYGLIWGFFSLWADCRLEAQFFLTAAAGLNNQQLGKSLLFQSSRVVFGNIPKMRGHLVDCLD
jgi:hypothetical protein